MTHRHLPEVAPKPAFMSGQSVGSSSFSTLFAISGDSPALRLCRPQFKVHTASFRQYVKATTSTLSAQVLYPVKRSPAVCSTQNKQKAKCLLNPAFPRTVPAPLRSRRHRFKLKCSKAFFFPVHAVECGLSSSSLWGPVFKACIVYRSAIRRNLYQRKPEAFSRSGEVRGVVEVISWA
ncbi:hypothetical protein TNIN_161811 [Trichonephila inaurata madagascariensis]|uniref:Uncharacterized protein n=1 Tax=Trichonephila inaurata madagascariensis TaxID=2747483 RepID=A0A8X7CUY7_9ARAC|nr:hypothetical protein TNIN_161811 [Trichonephila inaurata madagascariensis]